MHLNACQPSLRREASEAPAEPAESLASESSKAPAAPEEPAVAVDRIKPFPADDGGSVIAVEAASSVSAPAGKGTDDNAANSAVTVVMGEQLNGPGVTVAEGVPVDSADTTGDSTKTEAVSGTWENPLRLPTPRCILTAAREKDAPEASA